MITLSNYFEHAGRLGKKIYGKFKHKNRIIHNNKVHRIDGLRGPPEGRVAHTTQVHKNAPSLIIMSSYTITLILIFNILYKPFIRTKETLNRFPFLRMDLL